MEDTEGGEGEEAGIHGGGGDEVACFGIKTVVPAIVVAIVHEGVGPPGVVVLGSATNFAVHYAAVKKYRRDLLYLRREGGGLESKPLGFEIWGRGEGNKVAGDEAPDERISGNNDGLEDVGREGS